MWNYEKKLQYPVNIKNPNPAYAKIILTQLGGPDGEMGATTRYLNQRYTMPYATGKAILTDIATEEADHFPCMSLHRVLGAWKSTQQTDCKTGLTFCLVDARMFHAKVSYN